MFKLHGFMCNLNGIQYTLLWSVANCFLIIDVCLYKNGFICLYNSSLFVVVVDVFPMVLRWPTFNNGKLLLST
jgi:hypothetical protein